MRLRAQRTVNLVVSSAIGEGRLGDHGAVVAFVLGMTMQALAPRTYLLLAVLAAVAMLCTVLSFGLGQPHLGLRLVWDAAAHAARVEAASGPARAIPVGARLVSVSAGPKTMVLVSEDFTPEPDAAFQTFEAYERFLKRQGALAALQAKPVLELRDATGRRYELRPGARRPLSTLSAEFWVQVLVGLFAWLISAAVWTFRRSDPAARYLLLSGFSTLLFAPLAGVYSTRELALSARSFLWLSDLNFFGGCLYCASLIALLWYYPKRLGALRVGPVVVLSFVVWFVVQELGGMENMLLARRLPVFVALPLTFVLSAVQWRATRHDPVARAALSWFLLSWLLGTTIFATLTMVPQLFGIDMGFLQGYAFALFLLVYGGLAFGILRFRLFQLGEWWFRIFTWVLGAALLVVVDLVLFAGLSLPKTVSLGVSLLVCGFLWLPLRGLLWSRMIGRATATDSHDLFRQVIDVAFAPTGEERASRFAAMLERLFEPLRVEVLSESPREVAIEEDGLSLIVPAVGGQRALRLGYAGRGRRLYAPRDAALLAQVVAMLRHVDDSREAYNLGAREERTRIARDLHDDIGSRLLSGLHQSGVEGTKEVISQALADMRTIIHGLTGKELTLENVVAELRHETSQRLEAAGIALEWPLADGHGQILLSYAVYKNFLSVMRELVANAIRHARAGHLHVTVESDGTRLFCQVRDDGIGFDGERRADGLGVPNLRRRLAELSGSLRYERTERGTLVRIEIPLASADTHAQLSTGGAP